METIDIVLSASITVVSLGMFMVSILSYKKFKNMKLLFVSLAFFVFFLKGFIESLSLFTKDLAVIDSSVSLKLFDLFVLILLFVATLKR
ncbi:MAG: hypothetical protein NT038_06020 [Euryarchaeota archaeon]|nr:hypothetical protein [Euryarchaeota archaeon]